MINKRNEKFNREHGFYPRLTYSAALREAKFCAKRLHDIYVVFNVDEDYPENDFGYMDYNTYKTVDNPNFRLIVTVYSDGTVERYN